MSGHSKWATTKHKKAAIDGKRAKLFAKLIKNIEVAARLGGPDLNGNPTLYDAVQKGRKSSLPNDNIERAIKRGSGVGAVEAFLYRGSEELAPLNLTQDSNSDWNGVQGSWLINGVAGTFHDLADGDYTIRVTAKDVAGNSSFQSLLIHIDQTAPTMAWTIDKAQLAVGQTALVTMSLSETLSALPVLSFSQVPDPNCISSSLGALSN